MENTLVNIKNILLLANELLNNNINVQIYNQNYKYALKSDADIEIDVADDVIHLIYDDQVYIYYKMDNKVIDKLKVLIDRAKAWHYQEYYKLSY